MQRLHPVFWKEGLFLRPHHFQLQDIYHEARTAGLVRSLNRYAWGVMQIDINPEALENAAIDLRRCEVLFQDGTVFQFPESGSIMRREFDTFIEPDKPLGVYLGVRRPRPGKPNMDTKNSGSGTSRTTVKILEHTDLATGENPAQIDTLELQGEFLFSSEEVDLDVFETVKITEILVTGRKDPPFRISPDFFPPALSLVSSPQLHTMCDSLVDLIIAKARVMGEEQQVRGLVESELGKAGRTGYSMFYALSSNIPFLLTMVKDGWVHPFQFYLALCQLYGGLCAFSQREQPWDLPEYNHEDLASCFIPLQERIKNLLEIGIPTSYILVPVNFEEDFFVTTLEMDWLDRSNSFVLAVGGDLSEEDIKHQLINQSKISSRKQMEDLIYHALPGLALRYMEEPPAEIPKQANRLYFKLDTGHATWDVIRKDQNLCLYSEYIDPQKVIFELYVILKGKPRNQ